MTHVAMADPEFHTGEISNPKGGGAKQLFWPFSPKTAWKWKKIEL